jgi:transcriptional regulator with XRE-family HTH domain
MEVDGPLSSVLRQRREQLGLTLLEVGNEIGVHYSTVLRYEQGNRKPSLDMLEKLAAVLRIARSDLMAMAGFTVDDQLPGLRPYLRTKYGLDERSIDEVANYVRAKASLFGDVGMGPADGEDERSEYEPTTRT